MAAVQGLKLPVPARKVYKHSVSAPDLEAECSPVQSAQQVCARNSPMGKRLKWSKQRFTWRLSLPALGDHELVLEVQRSFRGRRRVLVNGLTRLDTRNPLSKMSFFFNLSDTHRFEFVENEDGTLKLLVDDVPFDDLQQCQTTMAWAKALDKAEKPKTESYKLRAFPGFGKFGSV